MSSGVIAGRMVAANPEAIVGSGSLWLAVPIALLAGFLSFASPCVLPLVPGYLGFLSGTVSQAEQNTPRRRLVGAVLLFIAGFSLVFVFATVLSGSLGVFFVEHRALITRLLGVVVIVLGCAFAGWIPVAQRTAKLHLSDRFGLAGAPLLGVVLGIGWTPCLGPTLATIMGLAWTTGDVWRAGILGLSYSLGLGIPFVLVAIGFGWATRAVGFLRRHIRSINIAGGVILIVIGVLMLTGVWDAWMLRLAALMTSVELPL